MSGPFRASYSDGKTAAAAQVEVNLTPRALVFRQVDSDRIHEWEYAELTSVGPLIPGEHCQIGIKDEPGAILFSEEVRLTEALIEHAPHLSKQAAHKRTMLPVLAIGGLVALLIAAIWIFDISVSRTIAGFMPENLRKGLGKEVAQSLSKGQKSCDSPEGLAALNKLVGRLTTNTEATKNFSVSIVPIGIINAFAAPGEQIVVSRSLVNFVRSPDELAGIVAHEMGHGIELHPEAGIVRSLGISAAMQLMLGGNAGQLGEIGALLLQMSYSRSAEREADDHAIQIMREAGIRPKPFSDFFSRLDKRFAFKDKKEGKTSGDDSSIAENNSKRFKRAFEMFSSHPPLPERAKRIESLKPWPSRPILTDKEWQALRRICS